jgi:endoglucanase
MNRIQNWNIDSKTIIFQGILLFIAILVSSIVSFSTTTHASQLTTVEAENLSWTPANNFSIYNTTASGNKAVKATKNAAGTLTGPTDKLEAIKVTAKGDQCSGAPNMRVKLDGVTIANQSVSATTWTEYSFPVNVPAGNHTVEVSFTNQYNLWIFCTRALHTDKVVIQEADVPVPEVPAAPFNKGVNLTGWFQFVQKPTDIKFKMYTKQDFENIKALGGDTIRLPINLQYMTSGAPNYTLDPLFLRMLDEVVSWADQLDMHLILDNHTDGDVATRDDQAVLSTIWGQMAQHYNNSYENLYYEILNEPYDIDLAQWGQIQGNVINAIRAHDQDHKIIVTGGDWDRHTTLDDLPHYTDTNLIYTFHFYLSMTFTHQGADWAGMDQLDGVPFPYNAAEMPALPQQYEGTWIESDYNRYPQEGTVQFLKDQIKIAADFAIERQVPLLAGEFGVYDKYVQDDDRNLWYQTVREELESHNIAWTHWDYHGEFGLFEKNARAPFNGTFSNDLNVPLLQALGYNVPSQTEWQKQPETTGFTIYDDFIAQRFSRGSWWSTPPVNQYSSDGPQSGEFAMKWDHPDIYQRFELPFSTTSDLSQLKNNGYSLDFWAKSTSENAPLDFRFVDTDTGSNDHPWRMRTKITINGDQWQHFTIPLSQFVEHGSWEDGWFNPEGLFDWTNINKLEISPEDIALTNDTVWLDNIKIIESQQASRDPLKQPFASSSIWNKPIGTSAQYVDAQLPAITETYSADGEWTPIHYPDPDLIVMRPDAPMTNIYANNVGWDGGDRCVAQGGILHSVPVPTDFVIPNSRHNNGAAFLMPDRRTIVQTQPFTRCVAGGVATSMTTHHPQVDIYGAGIEGAHGGSGLSAIGGALRVGELRPGDTTGPRHALKINLITNKELFKCQIETDCFRWPANTSDSGSIGWYGTETNNTNYAMRMGALLAIPTNVNVNSLGLETNQAKLLAWTLQNYGAYVVDHGGPSFSVEEGPDGSFSQQFQSDWGTDMGVRVRDNTAWGRDVNRLRQALSVINNNSAASIGGGGTPLQPLAPEIQP